MIKRFAVITTIFAALTLGAQAQQNTRDIQKLVQFTQYLSGAYIDTINSPQLIEEAITTMLSQLDPHSAYVSAKEMKSVSENFNANFEGIGIEFNILKDTLLVVNTIPGGPSEKVGLLPNDRIVAVNDSAIIGITQIDVPKILRGPKGTAITVKVVRHSEKEPLAFRIVRDKIPIYTVDAAYKPEPRTGYIKINRFAATTNAELQKALANMNDIDALILDLRGNGGGYLEQAVAVSNTFLKKGSLIVSTEGRAVRPERFTATSTPTYPKGKLIVLVDEYSASASEIVAGAVQDWDRGLILGRRTFGKGLVQKQFPLVDGSAVRITVSRYHTPTSRAIQRPFVKGDKDKYYSDFAAIITKDTLINSDTTTYKTLISGRTVYAGGGITPDIAIARDTTEYTPFWAKLVRSGTITNYIIEYIDKNRRSLEREFRSFTAFKSGFTVSDKDLDLLIADASAKKIEFNETEFTRSKAGISKQLKALIAQKLWDTSEYFEIINQTDKEMLKALEVIKNWDRYSKGIKSGE